MSVCLFFSLALLNRQSLRFSCVFHFNATFCSASSRPSCYTNKQTDTLTHTHKLNSSSYKIIPPHMYVRTTFKQTVNIALMQLSGWILTTNKAFMRLFRYISGDNDKKQKIPMTVPVISKKQHKSKSVFYKANVTMSFFIPTAFQADPPVPTDDNVYIDNKSSFCVYVRSFSGWMWSGKWWNLGKLKAALKKDGLGDAYRKDYYYTAGYNSPMEWRFWERHNEIWFVKK